MNHAPAVTNVDVLDNKNHWIFFESVHLKWIVRKNRFIESIPYSQRVSVQALHTHRKLHQGPLLSNSEELHVFWLTPDSIILLKRFWMEHWRWINNIYIKLISIFKTYLFNSMPIQIVALTFSWTLSIMRWNMT